jgi:hypothetical protein
MSWAIAEGVAASAIGGLLSSSGSSGGGSPAKPFKRTTNTASGFNELGIMYNKDSLESMTAMTEYMGEIASTNQNFYRDTVMPFQQAAMEMDTKVLPAIEEVNSAGLEQMARDLMGNGSLSEVLNARVKNGGIEQGGLMEQASNMMQTEIDNLPTLEERVGQALTSVEGQFSNAGKAMARDYASRGQMVSRSDNRSLAIEKAKAKAAAVGTAGMQDRAERMNAATAGIAGGAQVEAAGNQGISTATQGLTALQQSNTQMVTGAKETLIGTEVDSGLDAMELQAGLVETSSQQEFGTQAKADSINQTSKGLGLQGHDRIQQGISTNP